MSLVDLLQTRRAALEGGVSLQVTAGSHAGALAALRTGVAIIGSGLDNDIVLIGDGLQERHFAIEVTNEWLGSVRVEPLDAAIRVNGRLIDIGRDLVAKTPLTIEAGRASIELKPKFELETFRRPALALVGLAALLLVGWPLVNGLASTSAAMFRPAEPQPFLAALPTDPAAHIAALQDRIRKADLGGTVTAEAGPAGAVVATGEVDEAGLARWRSVLQWNDSVPGAPLLLNNVGKVSDVLGANIRSAWLDGEPELILTNGQTVRIGGTLASGWRVSQIDGSGIVLTKDKLSRKIEF
ncbi:hypothetical protein GCM10007036_43570 [Alsobacter metallidurans]|uniref:YscD/Y4YQ C-terminal domain-containing protein n=1 Tax=Alsobacter metallidurans TaxID=340221 RepID=A0A917MLT5_9HYPH|nr:hypothetical protein [Alsobacter metallidurans]GGH31999.1 hypothetical protein GCM10007036_43570 [Alsobacter metallidurans]